jgi:outer membrane scaffolding protein for murein synthesis (MipA/OmpV family)
LWEAGLGVGVMSLPHYRGSAQRHTWVLPVPYFVYRGDVFKADRDGARAELLKGQNWHFDLSVGAGAPTRSIDNEARRGMSDLAPTLELGPNFNLMLARGKGQGFEWDVEFRVPVRGAFTVARSPKWVGVISSPNLNLDVRYGPWNVGVLLSGIVASRSQFGYYYDVAASEATIDRAAYRASGGYGGAQLVFGVSRRFGDFWFGGFGKVDELRGASFADSPLVKQRHTVSMGLALSWVMAKSTQTAKPTGFGAPLK